MNSRKIPASVLLCLECTRHRDARYKNRFGHSKDCTTSANNDGQAEQDSANNDVGMTDFVRQAEEGGVNEEEGAMEVPRGIEEIGIHLIEEETGHVLLAGDGGSHADWEGGNGDDAIPMGNADSDLDDENSDADEDVHFSPEYFFSKANGWNKQECIYDTSEHNTMGDGLKVIVWRCMIDKNKSRDYGVLESRLATVQLHTAYRFCVMEYSKATDVCAIIADIKAEAERHLDLYKQEFSRATREELGKRLSDPYKVESIITLICQKAKASFDIACGHSLRLQEIKEWKDVCRCYMEGLYSFRNLLPCPKP